MRVTLYVAGAVLELGGILLIGAPDLLPYTQRASSWLRDTARRRVDRLRLAIGRPRAKVVHVSGIASAQAFGSASAMGIVSVNANATLEERVEYLLGRERETQLKLSALEMNISAIEKNVAARLDELRAEMEEHVSKEISAAELQYRPLRFVGALALLLGLTLTTIANFL